MVIPWQRDANQKIESDTKLFVCPINIWRQGYIEGCNLQKKVRGPLTIALRKNFLRPIYLANSSNFSTQNAFFFACVWCLTLKITSDWCANHWLFSPKVQRNIMTVLSNSTIDGLPSVWPKGLKLVGDRKRFFEIESVHEIWDGEVRCGLWNLAYYYTCWRKYLLSRNKELHLLSCPCRQWPMTLIL